MCNGAPAVKRVGYVGVTVEVREPTKREREIAERMLSPLRQAPGTPGGYGVELA